MPARDQLTTDQGTPEDQTYSGLVMLTNHAKLGFNVRTSKLNDSVHIPRPPSRSSLL